MKIENKELLEFLGEIADWMMDNDYECGEQGSDIYRRLGEILDKNGADR